MKLYSVILACMMFMPIVGVSQDTSMVLVPKNTLTAQQKQVVEVQSAREWVGLGKEVGEAINSSLSAVTEQTSKFADTKIGHLTMALVVWKVIGSDLVRLIAGALLFIVIFPIIIWSMRKYMAHKYLVNETVDPATGKVTARKWDESRQNSDGITGHFVMVALLTVICALIMFA